MSYRRTTTITSLIFITLFVALVLFPQVIYWLFNLQQNDVSDFLAKRAGMLFLGLAILCFYSRNTSSMEVEKLVSLSIATSMTAMAVLGVFEFLRGNAGPGIMVAVFAELVIVLFFYRFWSTQRQKA